MSRDLYPHEEEVVATLQALGWSVLPPGQMEPLYSVHQLAEKLGISANAVYRRAASRGVGTRITSGDYTSHLIFRERDVAKMDSRPPGRPQKGVLKQLEGRPGDEAWERLQHRSMLAAKEEVRRSHQIHGPFVVRRGGSGDGENA